MKAYFEGDKDVFVFKPIPKAKRGRPKKAVTDINVGGKTNADHIRSMTDEELAGFIADIARHGNEFVYWYRSTNWLKQPYQEETT